MYVFKYCIKMKCNKDKMYIDQFCSSMDISRLQITLQGFLRGEGVQSLKEKLHNSTVKP